MAAPLSASSTSLSCVVLELDNCSQSTLILSPKWPVIVALWHATRVFIIYLADIMRTHMPFLHGNVKTAGMHMKNKHIRSTVTRRGLWAGSWTMYVEAVGKFKAVVSKMTKLYTVTKVPKVTVYLSKVKQFRTRLVYCYNTIPWYWPDYINHFGSNALCWSETFEWWLNKSLKNLRKINYGLLDSLNS